LAPNKTEFFIEFPADRSVLSLFSEDGEIDLEAAKRVEHHPF
jgi:hypothetical protein